ncbi:MAG: hypothetical protein IJ104_11175, partial [Methanobrevibacter sp.]|nr:hypothetical protein [Methanobrevibacter sp.]
MKRNMIFVIFLTFIISIGCVSASDDINSTDSFASDSADEVIGYELTGDFIELQNIIDSAKSGDNITLTKDYVGSGEMEIDKDITINGNGHYIDASGLSRMFWVRADNVIFVNTIFKNGNVIDLEDDTYGGSIYASGSVGIMNCEFLNNKAEFGGAIYSYKELVILNTKFTNNHAIYDGGAIFAEKNTTTIYNCEFTANSANAGGAINSIYDSVLNVADSKFTDNEANLYGAAIFAVNDFKSINNIYTSSNATMEFIDYYDTNSENDGTLYLRNNTMISSHPWKIWFEGDMPISSQTILLFANATVENDEDSVIIATFTDDSGNTIMADDIKYELYDDANTLVERGELYYNSGQYGYVFYLYIDEGTYTISGSPSSEVSTNCLVVPGKLNVRKTKSDRINAPDLTKYYGNSQPLTVTITDDNGKAISGADVTINLNGKPYQRQTESDGTARMNINLGVGTYDAVIEYGSERSVCKITILSTIKGNDLTKMYRNSTQYTVECHNSNGELIKNANIEFNINGVFYVRTTNDKGIAQMNINLNPGEYIITGKNTLTNEVSSNLITVLPTIVENYDLTKYYRNASQYRVKLLDAQGHAVGANESVSFNINGVMYVRTTDESGYAHLNINLQPGDYIITAIYNGFMASNNIHVLNILFAGDVNMEYKDGTQYEIKLLDGRGNSYPNQNISLNINGVLYIRQTDSQGIARLNLNLAPGNYIITATFNGLAHANLINIQAPINTYNCGNGHKLSIRADISVEEMTSEEETIHGFLIHYPDGLAELDVQYDYSDYDSNAVDEILDYYISYGARSQGYYRGWAILNMDRLTSYNYPQYMMWYGNGYLYSI